MAEQELLAESIERREAICDVLGSLSIVYAGDSPTCLPDGQISDDPVTHFIRSLLPEAYLDQYHPGQTQDQVAHPALLETRIMAIPDFLNTLVEQEVITADDAEEALFRLEPLMGMDLVA